MKRERSKGVVCPKCGWNDVRVTHHARLWDYALSVLALAPMRCRKCRLRFYRPWFMVKAAEAPKVETRIAVVKQPAVSILPALDEGPLPPNLIAVPSEPAPPSVLLVDEDAAMRKLLDKLLHREGYSVHHASRPSEATAELNATRIDVVIANLDDDRQEEVVQSWWSIDPGLCIVAFSNTVATEVLSGATPGGNFLMLPRPSRPRAVIHAVQSLRASAEVYS